MLRSKTALGTRIERLTVKVASNGKTIPRFRRDIEGLRAVAVVPVMLFHLDIGAIPGGFVGVDIFFVISGFLITGILCRDIEAGNYSLTNFYSRRVIRIFPALFVMFMITSLAAALLLYPTELREYGASLSASAAFSSNIYYLYNSNYFDTAAAFKPLLHTWSLAVEEQYYVFFPPLLALLWRGGNVRFWLWIFAGLSLGLSIWMLPVWSEGAFYLIFTRSWELLAGSLLAIGAVPQIRRRWLRELTAAIGLALIAGTMLTLSASVAFPGLSALPPCLGAVMVIHAGQNGESVSARVLSLAPISWIGKLSYSLYLWHWPIIVFYKLAVDVEPDKIAKILIAIVTLVFASLSFQFVERPFRNHNLTSDKRCLFRWAAAAVFSAVALGLMLIASDGLSSRYPVSVSRMAAWAHYQPSPSYRTGTCFISSTTGKTANVAPECLAKDVIRPNVLLMGDSHAAHLWFGLSRAFPEINVLQATISGCKPLVSTPGKASCIAMRDKLFTDLHQLRPDTVIIAANWGKGDIPRLAETVKEIRRLDIPVVVFGPITEYRQSLPRVLATAQLQGDASLVSRMRIEGTAYLDSQMRRAAESAGARYISIYRLLCNDSDCRTTVSAGVPVQFDYGHLTAPGSMLIAETLRSRAGAHVLLPAPNHMN